MGIRRGSLCIGEGKRTVGLSMDYWRRFGHRCNTRPPPELYESVLVERHQSKSESAYDALDWPVVQYSLNLNQAQRGSGVGPLIGDDSPSFFQFQAAVSAFFGIELTGRNMESGPWLLRRQDTAGRITRVGLRPASAITEVTVEAPDLSRMALELASDHPGVSHPLSSYP